LSPLRWRIAGAFFPTSPEVNKVGNSSAAEGESGASISKLTTYWPYAFLQGLEAGESGEPTGAAGGRNASRNTVGARQVIRQVTEGERPCLCAPQRPDRHSLYSRGVFERAEIHLAPGLAPLGDFYSAGCSLDTSARSPEKTPPSTCSPLPLRTAASHEKQQKNPLYNQWVEGRNVFLIRGLDAHWFFRCLGARD
jgi:hypothetical protein